MAVSAQSGRVIRAKLEEHDNPVSILSLRLAFGVIKNGWGKPQGKHVGLAFVQLLKRVFGAFLEDPTDMALFSASAAASSSAAPQTRALLP